jgi:KGK domain
MNNQTTKIIADSQAVVRCLDAGTKRFLGPHATFTIDELLEEINRTSNSVMSLEKISSIFYQVLNVGNYGSPDLLKEINENFPDKTKAISKEKSQLIFSKIRTDSEYSHIDFLKEFSGETAMNSFVSGVTVLLLQPDGKGWQKGRLKICFEFAPEEDELVVIKEDLMTTQNSSVDEI